MLSGVWVADRPLDPGDFGGSGVETDLLAIDVPDAALADFEVYEDGKPYREWCVPATLLNAGRVQVTGVQRTAHAGSSAGGTAECQSRASEQLPGRACDRRTATARRGRENRQNADS